MLLLPSQTKRVNSPAWYNWTKSLQQRPTFLSELKVGERPYQFAKTQRISPWVELSRAQAAALLRRRGQGKGGDLARCEQAVFGLRAGLRWREHQRRFSGGLLLRRSHMRSSTASRSQTESKPGSITQNAAASSTTSSSAAASSAVAATAPACS